MLMLLAFALAQEPPPAPTVDDVLEAQEQLFRMFHEKFPVEAEEAHRDQCEAECLESLVNPTRDGSERGFTMCIDVAVKAGAHAFDPRSVISSLRSSYPDEMATQPDKVWIHHIEKAMPKFVEMDTAATEG